MVAFLSLVSALGVPSQSPQAHLSPAARRARFERLVAAEWEWSLDVTPEYASLLNDFRANDRWSDQSPENQRQICRKTKEFLREFERIDPTGFSAQDAISFQMMVQSLKDAVESYDLKQWEMPFDPFSGMQISVATTVPSFDFTTRRHYDDYLSRLRRLPRYMSQVIDCAQMGLRDGMMPLDVFVAKMVAQARQIADAKGDASPFVTPALKFPKAFTAAERRRYHDRLVAAVARYVSPTFRHVTAFLSGPYAKAARHDPGIWSLPHGDQLYRYDLRTLTTTDYTPKQLHALGLKQVQADLEAENAIAKQQGFGDRRAYLAAIKNDPNERFKSGDELLQRYRDDLRGIEAVLPKYFGTIPKQPLGVFPVEEYRQATTDLAEYQQGAPDGSRPGRVMVNPRGYQHRPKSFEDSIAYHEGEPGHHLQISIGMSVKGLPKFRRFGFYSAYMEGWALYCEGFADEIGAYKTPAARFGMLDNDMLRACRLVVDTGVHSMHWSRQQMVDFMTSNYIIGEKDEIGAAVDRYISWPGQACAYKTGQLAILGLRHEAEKTLGTKFDIRAFHDELLRFGAVPLYVLQREIRDWIKLTAQKGA